MTEAERQAATQAWRRVYAQARRDGTWVPKKLLGAGERVIDLSEKKIPVEHSVPAEDLLTRLPEDEERARKELDRQRAVRLAKTGKAGESGSGAAQLAEKQRTWTAEEWAAWRAKEEGKRHGVGTASHLVKSVVKILAEEQGADEDTVMEKVLECGGVDFMSAA